MSLRDYKRVIFVVVLSFCILSSAGSVVSFPSPPWKHHTQFGDFYPPYDETYVYDWDDQGFRTVVESVENTNVFLEGTDHTLDVWVQNNSSSSPDFPSYERWDWDALSYLDTAIHLDHVYYRLSLDAYENWSIEHGAGHAENVSAWSTDVHWYDSIHVGKNYADVTIEAWGWSDEWADLGTDWSFEYGFVFLGEETYRFYSKEYYEYTEIALGEKAVSTEPVDETDPTSRPFLSSLSFIIGLGVIGFVLSKGKTPIVGSLFAMCGLILSWSVGWVADWIMIIGVALFGLLGAFVWRSVIGG